MPDKALLYSGPFCNTLSFSILHLGLFFAHLSRGVGYIEHCDAIVFEKFRFHCPHEKTKTDFSKISTLESVFGHGFHRIRVDARPRNIYHTCSKFVVNKCAFQFVFRLTKFVHLTECYVLINLATS